MYFRMFFNLNISCLCFEELKIFYFSTIFIDFYYICNLKITIFSITKNQKRYEGKHNFGNNR